MLLVKTLLNTSHLHGYGLFALKSIKAGTVIGKFNTDFDRIFDNIDGLPITTQNMIRWYGYKEDGKWHLNMDNARFMNHSAVPNTQVIDECDVAIKDILSGEEITCDYFTFDETADEKLAHI